MSSLYLAEVWTLKLDTTAKLLLAFLADSADRTGLIAPMETHYLAETIDRNNKTTNKALRKLEELGILRRKEFWWLERWWIFDGSRTRPLVFEELFDPAGTSDDAEKGGSAEPEKAPAADRKPAAQAKPDGPAVAAPEELPIEQQRFNTFAAAWDPVNKPSSAVIAWQALEDAEAKYNRNEKHSKDGKTWVEKKESIEALLPAILNAVACYQARLAEGLPVHADNASEFIERQLWLAPEYQGKPTQLEAAGDEYTEAELDDMVMRMNQKGGHFQTHLRVSSKNPHTGELETETLAIYAKRVLAKWNQYQAAADYFEG